MDIDKEEIGITVAHDDVAGWINAIHRIADHPEEAQKMGANARKLAEKRFNLEIFSREIAESLLAVSYTHLFKDFLSTVYNPGMSHMQTATYLFCILWEHLFLSV